MKVAASSIDPQLDQAYGEFQDTFGIGPCGGYAAVRREHGWGDVASCAAHTPDGVEFGHYIIVWNGAIIDLANPLGEELTYTDVEVLPADELPDLVDAELLDWMRERIDK